MNLEKLLFVLLFFTFQIIHFNAIIGRSLFLISLCIFIALIFQKKIKRVYARNDIYFLFIFIAMFLLNLILYFFGYIGEFVPRPLFLHSLFLLLIFLIVSSNSEKDLGLFYLRVFLGWFFIESLSILAQYLYFLYGIGLQTKSSLEFVIVEGTTLNPNDTSVMLLAVVSLIALLCKKYNKIGLLFLVFLVGEICIFLAASRTCFALYNLFFLVLFFNIFRYSDFKHKLYLFFSFIMLSIGLNLYIKPDFWASNDLLIISLAKLMTLGTVAESGSAGVRTLSMVRLLESINRLGIGSFSDLNYSKYYHYSDYWLNTVNPHSFLAEFSFLFGYAGLILAFSLTFLLVYRVFVNTSLEISMRFILVIFIVMLPFVPSSVLAMPLLFILFYMMGSLNFNKFVLKNKV